MKKGMKKKIIALALVAALGASAAIGGSLAYFTDTDDATNTFTVGNVQIELIEQERKDTDDDGEYDELGTFTQDKVLMPIVGSAQGAKDDFGLPAAENYVDKIVTVKNTGASDAYVRVFVAVPHNLDDGADTYDAANNVLHFNFGSKEDGTSTDGKEWTWMKNGAWDAYEAQIDEDVKYEGDGLYTVYVGTYNGKLAPDATTERAINGFYLDANVDMSVDAQGNKTWTKGDDVVYYALENGVKVPVFVQAVQADGFATAEEAFTAAGMPTNPWA